MHQSREVSTYVDAQLLHNCNQNANTVTNEQNNTHTNDVTQDVSSLGSGSQNNQIILDYFTIKRNTKAAVKTKLFPIMMFICNNKELDYSNNTTAILKIICDELNITPDDSIKMNYWNAAKKFVPRNLNIRQTTVTFAIKCCYKSK